MSYLGGRTIYIDSDGNEHFDYERDYEPKPITNYDRIISKTPEELASYLTGVWYSFEELPGMCDVCDKNSVQNCSDCWLDWLEQEATDGT